jgi:F-box and WD-40 domain protein 1/11
MNSPLQWAAQRDMEGRSDDSAMEGGVSLRMEDTEMKDLSQSLPPTPLALSPTLGSLNPPAQPSLLLDPHVDPMVNWQYLYKQKRRLEANWQLGKYKNFQLPHPDHQDEAHAECVYTVQYSATHLVSGSRDKTLRIWNLSTQRLIVPPLRGHNASVLCLQFDDRPEHDLVVSGGSDCHVILWRFSTGKMITKLERAHSESVLNLRFDERYLITCSKDKTIKIWNRKPLMPLDEAYPTRSASVSAKYPSYILDVDNMLESDLLAMKPLREYSLLATLEGHNAAVNAIQVLGSQIVSASGDRLIKIWDVKSGQCLKTIGGHQKGIACVQFDGRRIVSGSSDETVRIFDRVSGAEVACLKGHKNLVRTVQARFGDVPGSELEQEAEARHVDRQFFKAQLDGTLRRDRMTKEQRRNRNAGSNDPNDVFAFGAKLPPGGGGSKWARIVSGSYDETVIIWRRDSDGKWVPAHQLNQSEAVLAAGGQPRQPSVPNTQGQIPPIPPIPNAQLQINASITQLNFQQWLQQNGHMLTPAQVAQMQAQMAHNLQLLNQTHASANAQTTNQPALTPAAASNATVAAAGASSSFVGNTGSTSNATASSASAATQASNPSTPQSTPSNTPTPQPQPSLAQQALQGAVPQQWLNNLPHHPHGAQVAPAPTQSQTNTAGQAAPLPLAQPAIPPHPHHHHHHHHQFNPINPTGSNSRVFKLQFDSRRII